MYEINNIEQKMEGSAVGGFNDGDFRFFKHIRKIYKYLAVIDKMKAPGETLFSECFDPLSTFIKEKTDWETRSNGISNSTLTSNFSNISLLKNNHK
jgi:hypothetical protein